ncbi:MAG: site-specific integrase [Treponema sp.]|nr:site-specific integrase [Treponema sp.]
MSVKIRIKRGYFYLDIIQNRRHHWEALHLKASSNARSKREQMRIAEGFRAKRELQIAMGEWNFTDRISAQQKLVDYIEKIVGNKKRHSPMYNCLQWVKKSADGGHIQLQSATETWVRSFQEMLLESHLCESSVNKIIRCLKVVFNRAVREGILVRSPAMNIKMVKEPPREKDVLSPDDVVLMHSAETKSSLEAEVKRGFLFACYTGLRISDLQTLTWANIEKKKLSKYNHCTFWIKKQQVKTKGLVEIPISATALALIEPFDSPDSFVFKMLAVRTERVGNSILKRLAKRVGITKSISWHTARRTFATLELESGADPFTVQRLMGHKSIKMTGIYAKSNNIKSSAVMGLMNMIVESDSVPDKQLSTRQPEDYSGECP